MPYHRKPEIVEAEQYVTEGVAPDICMLDDKVMHSDCEWYQSALVGTRHRSPQVGHLGISIAMPGRAKIAWPGDWIIYRDFKIGFHFLDVVTDSRFQTEFTEYKP